MKYRFCSWRSNGLSLFNPVNRQKLLVIPLWLLSTSTSKYHHKCTSVQSPYIRITLVDTFTTRSVPSSDQGCSNKLLLVAEWEIIASVETKILYNPGMASVKEIVRMHGRITLAKSRISCAQLLTPHNCALSQPRAVMRHHMPSPAYKKTQIQLR